MNTVEIPSQLDDALEALAARNGASKSDYLQKAIASFIEDMEDIAILEGRLKNPGQRYTLQEVVERLGLDD